MSPNNVIDHIITVADQSPEVDVYILDELTVETEILDIPIFKVKIPEVFVLVVDVEAIGYSGPVTHYGMVYRPFVLNMSTRPEVTDFFGEVSASFDLDINTAGTIDPTLDEYGSGTYGSGLYGDEVHTPETFYGSTSLAVTFGAVVYGDFYVPPPIQTGVAEISLASHGTPSARTNHSIKIRARTLTGSGAVIRAALYQGAVNRSGDLSSNVLTNTLADFVLPISDGAAATITDYSNLSIKIWGYDYSGLGLVFEVANLSLELPTP